MRKNKTEIVNLEKIVGGGQAIGELENGQKIFVWGALPGETAEIKIIKKKNKLSQGIAEKIIKKSPQRIPPQDIDSFISTSPWQIMNYDFEKTCKQNLVQEAFELHGVDLSQSEIIDDGNIYEYRNKIEFSWWWDNEKSQLDLAFFRRGAQGKIPVNGTSLAREEINIAARKIRDFLRQKNIEAYGLKTLLIRAQQNGEVAAQLYVKDEDFTKFTQKDFESLKIRAFEIIYSNPKSPASVITKKLQTFDKNYLRDKLLDREFVYSVEGFFQVNLPVYEMALDVIKKNIPEKSEIVDLYSGVGTIGLSVGQGNTVLVEQDESCVKQMEQNLNDNDKDTKIVHAATENVLEFIKPGKTIIVDPPRAGLHSNVVEKLNQVLPPKIIYLSCNPVTQARDVSLLLKNYKITHSKSFNFFPRTPHIEHLLVLELT